MMAFIAGLVIGSMLGATVTALFAVGVDKVNVVTEGGLLCRLFERRDA